MADDLKDKRCQINNLLVGKLKIFYYSVDK